IAVVVKAAEVIHVGVANKRVVDIHIAPVGAASVIPRTERFTESQREPAKTEAAAEEADEGRTIEGPRIDRAGAPTPTPAKPVPAAIVVGSKAPRLVTNPRPAPRPDPVPGAVAVRSPVRADIVGCPDRAVVGLFAPSAVLVQVAITDGVARNVFGGWGVVFLEVAILCPAIEIIRRRGSRRGILHIGVAAGDVGTFPSLDGISLPAGGNFTLATNHGNAGVIAIFVDVDAEVARLFNVESKIRRIHFVGITLKDFANAEIEFAFGETHLSNVLIKIQERDGGHTAEMEGGLTCLQLRARVLVHPELIADGHGAILPGSAPITGAAGLQRDGTVCEADAGDAGGRIVRVIRT